MIRGERIDLSLQVKALELLAEELEVGPERLQEYWAVSTDLIQLSTEIDEFALNPEDDAYFLDLTQRLRTIASRLVALSYD